jgi:RNA polymerase sigma-70 factor (ECF subfamily)
MQTDSATHNVTEEVSLSAAIERALTRFGDVARRAGAAHGLDGDDMEDVLQEVRIRLWRGGSVTKLDALSPAYIYRAAVSSAIDLIRRRRTKRELRIDFGAPTEQVHEWADTAPAADAELMSAEMLDTIGNALDTLAVNRQVVVRMHLKGYTREETAALLRWSEAKTRNLLYRGLEDLRLELGAQGLNNDT